MRYKKTAVLLALFLGFVGRHHFYLGNRRRGFLYLMFFWTFIPAIVSIYESILLLISEEEAFNLKYNHNPFIILKSSTQPQLVMNLSGDSYNQEELKKALKDMLSIKQAQAS